MSIDFTRRQFLAASGTALAASALGLGPTLRSVRAGENTGKIKKAVKYHMVQGDLSVVDKFKLVKDLGYEGLEIHTRDKTDRRVFAKARDQSGLPIHGVLNSSNPDIVSAIDLAKYFGADSVLVVAGRVNEKKSYDDNYRETQAIIRSALPHAEKQGMRILVENVWNNFLLSPLEMARYLDELESPAVGAYFDVGNVVRFGWPDQWIRILGSRIAKLDIKEYSRKLQLEEGLRKGFNVEIGDGDCDWPNVRKALAEIGYTGWATAEVPGGGRDRLLEIAQRIDRVLDL